MDFDPALGSLIPLMEAFVVTVTAYDYEGNSASCDFVYEAQRNYIIFVNNNAKRPWP